MITYVNAGLQICDSNEHDHTQLTSNSTGYELPKNSACSQSSAYLISTPGLPDADYQNISDSTETTAAATDGNLLHFISV